MSTLAWPRRLVVLGSTGSIGVQTLEVVGAMPDRFVVVGLAAGRNLRLLEEQVARFRPKYFFSPAYQRRNGAFVALSARLVEMEEMVAQPEVDLVVVATVGKAGLGPTLAALRAGKKVALANKEVLVMAGELIAAEARQYGAELLPIDSEHSALWQCLRGEASDSIARLVLTTSGGAFRDYPLEQLADVTPTQALQHPTWRMGKKVTVDSATLINKGFEVIEARWLFDVPYGSIDVLLHRESVVHSMVEFMDGTIKAQLGMPDMRLPIQYALTYPLRLPAPVPRLNLAEMGRLTFGSVDLGRYPCLGLALEAARKGGTFPAVLSAADDEAVSLFLAGEIGFLAIAGLVGEGLGRHRGIANPTLEEIIQADEEARVQLRQLVATAEARN